MSQEKSIVAVRVKDAGGFASCTYVGELHAMDAISISIKNAYRLVEVFEPVFDPTTKQQIGTGLNLKTLEDHIFSNPVFNRESQVSWWAVVSKDLNPVLFQVLENYETQRRMAKAGLVAPGSDKNGVKEKAQ